MAPHRSRTLERGEYPAAPSTSSCSCMTILLVLSGGAVVLVVLHWLIGVSYKVFLAGLLVLFLLFFVTAHAWHLLDTQRKNKRARKMLSDSLSGRNGPEFALLLRQFQSPKLQWGIQLHSAEDVIWQVGYAEQNPFGVPDWFEDIWGDIPLIRVAESVNVQGGSVRLSDAEWQETVLRLIMLAKAIIIVPGVGAGIGWEIMQVRSHDRLPISLFFMPPESTDPSDRADRPAETLWSSLVVKYQSIGLPLPAYDPDGLLFRFDRDGTTVQSKIRLTTATLEGLKEFMMGQGNEGSESTEQEIS